MSLMSLMSLMKSFEGHAHNGSPLPCPRCPGCCGRRFVRDGTAYFSTTSNRGADILHAAAHVGQIDTVCYHTYRIIQKPFRRQHHALSQYWSRHPTRRCARRPNRHCMYHTASFRRQHHACTVNTAGHTTYTHNHMWPWAHNRCSAMATHTHTQLS